MYKKHVFKAFPLRFPHKYINIPLKNPGTIIIMRMQHGNIISVLFKGGSVSQTSL